MAKEGQKTGVKATAAGVDLRALALGAVILVLGSCSSIGSGPSGAMYGSACQPFDPDVTHSCVISSERWSEIAEMPEPPGMYRYCAWPGLLSGDYQTRYRDVEGKIHDYTQAPVQTPSFLLEALKGADNSPTTDVVDYRMMPNTHPCPNAPP